MDQHPVSSVRIKHEDDGMLLGENLEDYHIDD